MLILDHYLDAARSRQNLPSDRQLAIALGVTPGNISIYRHGKSWPSDNTMYRLAELAGVPVEVALLDLNCWRTDCTEAAFWYHYTRRQWGSAHPDHQKFLYPKFEAENADA
jgi:transcriptional regulator with XRE-family HTH domain